MSGGETQVFSPYVYHEMLVARLVVVINDLSGVIGVRSGHQAELKDTGLQRIRINIAMRKTSLVATF